MIRRFLAGALSVATVVAAAGLTACGSGEQEGPENPAAVAWAEEFCRTVRGGGDLLSRLPKVDTAEPDAGRTALVDYLGRISTALTEVETMLRREGAPPVDSGDAALRRAVDNVTGTRSAVEEARSTLAGAEITDARSYERAITSARSVFDEVNLVEGPERELRANPELDAAFDDARACRQLGAPA
ncbi:hypothetical protein B0I33_114128 [Prauserella shujinwangii]|uniref:Lipoprotein n=1 Tax=Prauserella shujinwangii TaxID=1453103 RepID=A0A2T0LL37_9PSEU|nr:hypothetical protein [Prauserella shujinwangii]PRX43667.1 hypothetical protein B0I33_114128 [Prauserella shujinwangii]